MKKTIPFVFIVAFIISCGGAEETSDTESTEQDTTSVDTLLTDTITVEEDPAKIEIDVEAMLAKAETIFELEDLPLTIDSNFVDEYTYEGEREEYNMTGDEAKYLSFELCENQPMEMASWDIQTFIRLDSIRNSGGWDDYQSTIDLGQARFSDGNIIGKIMISDQSFILLWHIQYATYEACPYGEGSYIYGTLFTNNVGLNTTLLAEVSSGGDPPSWGATTVNSIVSAEQIITESLQRWGEEDYDTGEEFVDTREGTVRINITPTSLEEESEEGFESPY